MQTAPTIDGAQGEGGGQILRTALTLSLCLGQPFRIFNIRKARERPGLRPQHLAAVHAAAEIGHAEVEGAVIGSDQLEFIPRRVESGDYQFDVGTAGSATLVLQTVLPALLIADGPSHLRIVGGTHNPLAPPYDFLKLVFIPLINRIGPRVSLRLERSGFYPAGGGIVMADIEPAVSLMPLHLLERGPILEQRAWALIANLPAHIGRRELRVLGNELGYGGDQLELQMVGALGPGNAVMVMVRSAHLTEVFSAIGQRGVRAEAVAHSLVGPVKEYLASGAPVGGHLADQLLLPLALAGKGSFVTLQPSQHTATNADVIRRFIDIAIRVAKIDAQRWRVDVGPPSGEEEERP